MISKLGYTTPFPLSIIIFLTFFFIINHLQLTIQQSDIYINNNDSIILLNNSDNLFNNILKTNELIYTLQDVINIPPINQFYYAILPSFDSPTINLCHFSNKSLSCFDYFCKNNYYNENNNSIGTLFNFENETIRNEFRYYFNYCIFCNNSESKEFLDKINNLQCEENLSKNIINNFLINSYRHCNGNDILNNNYNNNSIINLNNIKHLPILESNFFNTIYFTRKIKKTKFTIKEIMNTYQFTISLNENPPFDIPIMCFCEYQLEKSYLSFQCHDYNSDFQLITCYRVLPFFFVIFFLIIFILNFILIIIPKYYERFYSLKKLPEFTIEKVNGLKFFIKIIKHFSEINSQPCIWFAFGSFFGFLENLIRIFFNFSFSYESYKNYFPGIFRGLSAMTIVCGYSSLVVLWSHVIDLSNRRGKETNNNNSTANNSNRLSKFNLIILIILYFLVLLFFIITLIIFAATKQMISWIVVCVGILIYLITFVFGFGFYGIKILITLRSVKNDKNIYEYKFTKFILAETVIFIIGWIITLLSCITYAFGHDIMGIAFAINRNAFLDTIILIIIGLSLYIMFNRNYFKKFYVEKWNCCTTTSKEEDK
ncbi:hypothetical protein ABK040_001577 [Willaertia magna]